MTATKKLLVGFDPADPQTRSAEFLVPSCRDGRHFLMGIGTGREFRFGMVVYTGKALTERDLFSRLIDSGATVPDVDRTMNLFRAYIDGIRSLKVGNIATIRPVEEDLKAQFRLELVATSPARFTA